MKTAKERLEAMADRLTQEALDAHAKGMSMQKAATVCYLMAALKEEACEAFITKVNASEDADAMVNALGNDAPGLFSKLS